MSDGLSQPLNAVSGPKPGGDDAASLVNGRSREASTLDSDFCKALQSIETPGYLKSYFTLPEHAHSGLSVYHVGDIALPLGEIQARQMMGQAKRPDYGITPWELNPTQFKLDYGVWEGRLKALYRHLAPGLGHDQDWIDSVRAEPSAVLLMEKGAIPNFSLGDKQDGTGYIVVYLPTADLQGGEIVTKFGRKEKTLFNPNQKEEHLACWYPNSKPQRVKSGYALAVLFTFFPIRGTISPSALYWRNETRAIRHTLKRWLSKDAKSRERIALYHPLQGNYMASRKLCLNELMMADDGRVQILKRISDNFGFKLYLGHVERDQKKLEPDGGYEDIKGSTRITKLLDLDGRLVTENLPLDETHVPEGFFNCISWESHWRRPPSLIRKGHMKRGGGDKDLAAMEGIPKVLGEYARMSVKSPCSKNTLPVFQELCELMWDPPRNPSEGDTQSLFAKQKPAFQNNDLIDVLKATIHLKWFSWFEKIAAAHEGSLSTSFFGWVPEYFHKSTVKIDRWFGPLEKGLSAAVLSYPRAKQQVRAVETLFPIIMADTGRLVPCPPECLMLWARQVLQECIKTCGSRKLDKKDGEALVKLSLYFEDPIAVISQVGDEIDPGSKPDAFLGFINEIDLFGRYDYISYEKSRELYRKASRDFITSTAFAQMHGKEKEERNEADFFSRFGDFVFGGPGPKNPMEHGESGSDEEIADEMMMDSEDDLDDYMPGARNYMPDGLDSNMDLDEPEIDPFGYEAHSHNHNHRDYKAYKAYQEFELNGGKPETEIVECQIQSATLGLWLQQVMNTSSRYDDILSLALSKMGEVAPQIPSVDFHTLWFPVLRAIAPKLGRLSLERAKDPNTLLWRKNIYILVKAYLDNFVGKWPRRPRLAQKGVGCDCADCKGLNVFLADASLKTGHFTASKKRCTHIVRITFKEDTDIYTERKKVKGKPHKEKLVLTKSRKKMLARARTAWKERRDEATKQLGTFEQKHLAALLGPEWMTLFSMAHLDGPSLSDMDMRKALRLKTERENIPREPAYMDPSTIAMFFGNLPSMSVGENYNYMYI
ncbi:hypothetical protein MKX08_000771 [Trichoderma sp. CBMAI-0020]|nr:hypothetical protein MKX08_000771 [Trichoderma sp. CBMAI-0020]